MVRRPSGRGTSSTGGVPVPQRLAIQMQTITLQYAIATLTLQCVYYVNVKHCTLHMYALARNYNANATITLTVSACIVE